MRKEDRLSREQENEIIDMQTEARDIWEIVFDRNVDSCFENTIFDIFE